MKRFAGLMVLVALTTPAYADSYSFVIAGHHIHVETSRHCRSLSCVSWAEVSKKRDRDERVATGADPAPAQKPVAAAAPAVAAPAPVAAPAIPAPVPAPVATQPAAPVRQPPIAPAPVQTQSGTVQQQASATPVLKPVETRTVVVTPPSPAPAKIDPPAPPPAAQVGQVPTAQVRPDPKVEPKEEPKVQTKGDAKVGAKIDPNAEAKPRVGFDLKPDAKLDPKPDPKPEPKVEQKAETKVEQKAETKPDSKPDTTASVTRTPEKQKPAVVAKPAPSKTTLQSEGEAVEAPIGDWQTEGRKGLVRIEPCGTALCGYMINTSTNAKGETVLINMKPKANSEWSGSIYSRASGNTYYATMIVKRPNTLRVEACVVGHYFCSGNNWSRVAPKPDNIISPRETREASADPAR
jgi:uncharacterized protein (DUF2147 family)